MSAWLVMNAMGIYQVCPGDPVYSVGRPMFEKMTVNLPGGKRLAIKADNFSKGNKYIASLTLNGKPVTTPFLNHADLMEGGELIFTMSDKPTQWGVK